MAKRRSLEKHREVERREGKGREMEGKGKGKGREGKRERKREGKREGKRERKREGTNEDVVLAGWMLSWPAGSLGGTGMGTVAHIPTR